MKRLMTMCLVVLLAAGGCGRGPREKAAPEQAVLTVMCGAGIRPALEPLRKQFEQAHGCRVRAIYAGSGTLLGQLMAGTEADLYVPGDASWVETAREKGLVSDQAVVAWFVPVIAVAKGNPKAIGGLRDLAREDVTVGLGNADACAVGGVSRDVLQAAGLQDAVKPAFEALTVNRLAEQVKLGALDAAIVWDAIVAQYADSVEAVQLEDSLFHAVPLAVGLIKASPNRELAREFMAFAAGAAGAQAFRENQYRVTGARLRIGCGGSMRPPVEELAALFEARTGCETLRDYGGSGPVLLQIEESREGDVYICHDPFAYLCEEKGLSERWHTMAVMTPVLAVQKGNPKQVKGLKDLLRDDVKVGLSHRDYSTRGRIIWAIFDKYGLADAMNERAFFEERTHTLVNQLKLGAVDVATLWDAPAKDMEEIDVIPIGDAYQIDAVTSATSRETYDPQKVKVTVVRLSLAAEPLLAAQFARLCLSPDGRRILEKHQFTLPETAQ
jgi:molybdate transport system substrate-binding protein